MFDWAPCWVGVVIRADTSSPMQRVCQLLFLLCTQCLLCPSASTRTSLLIGILSLPVPQRAQAHLPEGPAEAAGAAGMAARGGQNPPREKVALAGIMQHCLSCCCWVTSSNPSSWGAIASDIKGVTMASVWGPGCCCVQVRASYRAASGLAATPAALPVPAKKPTAGAEVLRAGTAAEQQRQRQAAFLQEAEQAVAGASEEVANELVLLLATRACGLCHRRHAGSTVLPLQLHRVVCLRLLGLVRYGHGQRKCQWLCRLWCKQQADATYIPLDHGAFLHAAASLDDGDEGVASDDEADFDSIDSDSEDEEEQEFDEEEEEDQEAADAEAAAAMVVEVCDTDICLPLHACHDRALSPKYNLTEMFRGWAASGLIIGTLQEQPLPLTNHLPNWLSCTVASSRTPRTAPCATAAGGAGGGRVALRPGDGAAAGCCRSAGRRRSGATAAAAAATWQGRPPTLAAGGRGRRTRPADTHCGKCQGIDCACIVDRATEMCGKAARHHWRQAVADAAVGPPTPVVVSLSVLVRV